MQQNAYETFAKENNFNLSDTNDAMKCALAFAEFMQAQNAQQIEIDVSVLDCDQLAEFVDFDVNKLTFHINDVDLKVFKQAVNVINKRNSELRNKLDELYAKRSEIAKEISDLKNKLNLSATIKSDSSVATLRTNKTNDETILLKSDLSSLEDCCSQSKSRRNAIVNMLEFLNKTEQIASAQAMKKALASVYDLSTFKQDQSSAIRNVAKELNLTHCIKK